MDKRQTGWCLLCCDIHTRNINQFSLDFFTPSCKQDTALQAEGSEFDSFEIFH
jgi:hypothetical protein